MENKIENTVEVSKKIWDGKWNTKRFVTYIVTAFVIAWILQIIASVFTLKGNTIVFQLILAVSMYAPFVATLVAGIPLRGMGWKPKFKGNILAMVAAWFGPLLFTVLGALLYYMIFPSRLDFTGKYLISIAGENVIEQLATAGFTLELYMLVAMVQCVTYAPFINMFAALGEEVGWRGAMQPMLIDRFGKRKGLLLGGFIWGAWHWPVMTLAGYEYGLNYWGYPILGMMLFCILTTVMGILLATWYDKTKCIWIPSLAHGAFNAAATMPALLLDTDYMNQLILGPAPVGIISMLPMLIVAVWLLIKEK